MDWVTILGLTAATGTTISFVPQVFKSWKTKRTKDVSLGMFVLVSAAVFLWLIYGLLISDVPLVFANSITLVLAVSMVIMKLKYG